MRTKLSQSDLTGVHHAQNEFFLGIIERDGTVRLKIAGPIDCPGHAEWVRQGNLAEVYRGFSMIVKSGHVTAFHRRSEYNPEALEFALEEEITRELLRMLPCIAGAQVFPDVERSESDDAFD